MKPENVTCPECGEPMVSRANKTSGQRVWGGSNYPTCKGTRNTDGDDTAGERPGRACQAVDTMDSIGGINDQQHAHDCA